jgi:ribonuclease Y
MVQGAALIVALAIAAWLYAGARRRLARESREIEESKQGVEALKKEALLEAKEEAFRLRREVEKENNERKSEFQRQERRLLQREESLERRGDVLDRKERATAAREADLTGRQEEIAQQEGRWKKELERASNLSAEEARKLLLAEVEKETRHEAGRLLEQIEQQTRQEAERRARNIVSLAVQRCAVDQAAETTVSVVPLPSDEMKGRIIGREGRNIRVFETVTGVDLIIDDTPEAVVISAFDPVRREVARIALETLVSDGRIHPGRIEESVEKAKRLVEEQIQQAGERATFETGVSGLHPEMVRLLGKMKFRTTLGQNALDHSIEVSHLAGVLAGELGANEGVARRAGLLHDIGKAVDQEQEGTHTAIGVELARRYRESGDVVHAIAAHHEDEEFKTVEAVLVYAADSISASRPGARRETLESYLKRLEKLEKIADSCPGVEKSYAIQAGREVRIMVKPEEVDDLAAARLARDIATKIQESGLEYPGQIRVTVIRETRVVEYAK